MTQIKTATKTYMQNAYFFGYGSLVNRATHGFADAHPARLTGWQRVWRHTGLRDVAYLTVVPLPGAVIDGLIAPVPDDDWEALDAREAAYDRVPAAHQIAHPLPDAPPIAVYAIPEGKHDSPSQAGPLLLSYIDVVVQGYLREFGESVAERFFATTAGWDAPVIADRDDPAYPRHQRLKPSERDFVDHHLSLTAARFIPR
jgi:hypothetical protein